VFVLFTAAARARTVEFLFGVDVLRRLQNGCGNFEKFSEKQNTYCLYLNLFVEFFKHTECFFFVHVERVVLSDGLKAYTLSQFVEGVDVVHPQRIGSSQKGNTLKL